MRARVRLQGPVGFHLIALLALGGPGLLPAALSAQGTVGAALEIEVRAPAGATSPAGGTVTVSDSPEASDSLVIRGEPILYGVTVPARARHRQLAEAFVQALYSASGRAAFREHGFLLPDHPITGGHVPPGLLAPR